MTLGSAMNMAMTGLSVSARLAELVSTNVANATTAGFVRREAEVSALVLGGQGAGVRISAVRRDLDPHLLAERRGADAALAAAQTLTRFQRAAESALGGAEDGTSLSSRIADLESALLSASGQPDSDSLLARVLSAAQSLTSQINAASQGIQALRGQADRAIASDVSLLNGALQKVQDMNSQIRSTAASGRDTAALQDLRQSTIDSIATIVPLRQVPRENGDIALYTTAGAALVEGRAAVFGFAPTTTVTADQALGTGGLGGLTLNGRPLATDATGLVSGGSLSAHFAIRDQIAPGVQQGLDNLAKDLILRFQDPAVDATRTAGEAALFTEAGAPLNPNGLPGLAGRLDVNAAVDPAAGGAIWRLRDGLGAGNAGAIGDPSLLRVLADTLMQAGSFGKTAERQAADLMSATATSRLRAEDELAYASTRATSLQEQEAAKGVDTDQELQHLMQIERAYSANARMLQIVDQMLATLMEI